MVVSKSKLTQFNNEYTFFASQPKEDIASTNLDTNCLRIAEIYKIIPGWLSNYHYYTLIVRTANFLVYRPVQRIS